MLWYKSLSILLSSLPIKQDSVREDRPSAISQIYASLINISHCMSAILKQTTNKQKNERVIRNDNVLFNVRYPISQTYNFENKKFTRVIDILIYLSFKEEKLEISVLFNFICSRDTHVFCISEFITPFVKNDR